jgi:hypothetical protein
LDIVNQAIGLATHGLFVNVLRVVSLLCSNQYHIPSVKERDLINLTHQQCQSIGCNASVIRLCRELPPSWSSGVELTAQLHGWSADKVAEEQKKLQVNSHT